MALEIKWSKRADSKFDTILEYLSIEWGEKNTESFVKKVYDFLDILSEFPEIGTLENKEKGIRGFTITKQLNVFYQIRENDIVILNFFDNRQSPQKRKF
ncbi:MAG: type II toxin-antitoxin system RelE/ParE family toxin [Bacteroidetes bacterium]|nr:type II toxin-antitoxin system RelE/ParE family toxin [Bacteroidota bacterium]